MKFYSLSLATALLAGVLVAGATTVSQAEQNYVPSGHAYGPGFEKLPPLNSRRDKINAQADIYEAEIRRRNLELRIQMENQRFHQDLNLVRPGGLSYFPY